MVGAKSVVFILKNISMALSDWVILMLNLALKKIFPCILIPYKWQKQSRNLAEEENMFRIKKRDKSMIPRDDQMTLEIDEEMQNVPCRKYGHIFKSREVLGNRDNTSHGTYKRFSCQNCYK